MKITSPLGPIIISVLVTAGFLATIFMLLTMTIDFKQAAGQVLLVLAGVLAQSFGMVTNFWLGSSASSMGKTEQLAAIASK